MPGLTRTFSPGGNRTTVPDIITYEPPVYDESQVRAFQQEAMAPGISGLRRVMREAQSGRYSSPTARREALRGATRGYGEALAPLQVGAGAQARQRYDIQYRQAIRAEEQRVASEERAAERAYQESLREEAPAAGQSIHEIRGGGGPIAATPEWVGHSTTGYYTGQPKRMVGLTEASRRPIFDEPEYGRSLYPQTVNPEPAYPTDWMNA